MTTPGTAANSTARKRQAEAGCVPCRVCGGSQTRGWHLHDQPTEAAPVADAADVEALLLLAERVCALVGWTATGDSDRDKALTEAWMEWARTRPHLTGRDAWPDLDDEGIAALAARRDATRAATLRRIARAEADR